MKRRYPDTLATLCRHWDSAYLPYPMRALIGQAGGKLYLLSYTNSRAGVLEQMRDDFRAMYPAAVYHIRTVSDWQNLPIAGPGFAFYRALGIEWREVELPFSGFYESWHSDAIDRELSQMFTDDSGCHIHPGLWQIAFDGLEHRAIELEYCKDYAAAFADSCGVHSVRFSGMDSPREYNFTTDRVFANVTAPEFERIKAATDSDILERIALERFSHRSGFISSYSPDVTDWGDFADWDLNQLGTLIRAYHETVTGDDWDTETEFALVGDLSGNGDLSNWIWGAFNTKAERAGDLARRMRDRASRGAGYEKTAAAFSETVY